jgi:hypothetical protein
MGIKESREFGLPFIGKELHDREGGDRLEA